MNRKHVAGVLVVVALLALISLLWSEKTGASINPTWMQNFTSKAGMS